MKSVLVTGANGFIGRSLCARLVAEGSRVRGTLRERHDQKQLTSGVEPTFVDQIDSGTDWTAALAGIDIIVHLAARVHVMHETTADPLAAFRRVNTAGTVTLAKEAAAAGVKRFVFLSTIGVNGDNSGQTPYREDSVPAPHNAYALSKLEAEEELVGITAESGMELVVLRAPLIYGPGNPGNFLSLLQVVAKGIPLPFAGINNRRSFLYVENLVDALVASAIHPDAKGVFLVCDGEDLSTADLIRRIAAALAVPARLFPCPLALLKCAGKLAGKAGAVRQLTNSLQVDRSKITKELHWTPPYTVAEGLLKTAHWFRQLQKYTR